MPLTNNSSGVSAGTVMNFAATAAPAGWIKANGAAVSRSAYAGLFLAIGTTFGAGDGATTFNVPDLRGEFLRCLDDGRGVDGGRGIGTYQAATSFNNSARSSGDLGIIDADSSVSLGTLAGMSVADYSKAMTSNTVRPRNVAMMACIKF